jgi:hypothetical protein
VGSLMFVAGLLVGVLLGSWLLLAIICTFGEDE